MRQDTHHKASTCRKTTPSTANLTSQSHTKYAELNTSLPSLLAFPYCCYWCLVGRCSKPISSSCLAAASVSGEMHVPPVLSLRALRTQGHAPLNSLTTLAIVPPVVLVALSLIFAFPFSPQIHSVDLPTPLPKASSSTASNIQVPRATLLAIHKQTMMEAWLHEDYYAGDNSSSDDVLESGGGSASGGGPPSPAPVTASAMRVRVGCVCLVHSFAKSFFCE